MAIQDINHKENGKAARQKINQNFAELETASQNLAQTCQQIAQDGGYQRQQIDYVELIRRTADPHTAQYWAGHDGGLWTCFEGANTVVSHKFIKEPEDDFIKWISSTFGSGDVINRNPSIVSAKRRADMTITGTWTVSNPNHYTTAVGATFSGTFSGTQLIMNTYCDNRGGIWRYVIDGNESNPIDISVWRETAGACIIPVWTGSLPIADHTITATFIGADPAHAPVGGTPRGWASDVEISGDAWRMLIGTSYAPDENYNALAYDSNRDIALDITCGASTAFVPAHSGVASAIKISDPVYTVDGTVVDMSAVAKYARTSFDKITISQHFYGVIGGTNAVEISMTTTIDGDGVITTVGSVTALASITVNKGYVPMLPLTLDILNTAVTSTGTVKQNTKDGATPRFSSDLDEAISVCGIDATRKNIISAMSIDKISHTNRWRSEKTRDDILWSTNSATLYMKIYNEVFNATALTSGKVYYFSSRHMCGVVDGIYDTVMGLF